MRLSRSDELRRQNRKVFAWSYAVAALAIGFVLFVWSPTYQVEPLSDPEVRREDAASGQTAAAAVFVRVLFGPPEILLLDGSVSAEPPTRVLEAARAVELPPECPGKALPSLVGLSGRLRLRVNLSGEATVQETVETTGSACGDRLVTAVADALLYHWLPSEEFPAPVELVQPVTVVDVAEAL